jgi:phosphatidylinositol alpha-1,6-mannosyltransferase
MRRTLIVTNDFPPRQGGIQSFVAELARRQPPGSVVVYASDSAGSAEYDAAQQFPVVRHPTGLLLPTPAARSRVLATMRAHGCTAVWFGASAPLGLLATSVRGAGAERIVASSHGHEIGWARLPGGRQALRRIGTTCDVITYLGEYTRSRIAGALGPHARLEQLSPGVDVETFHPGIDPTALRARLGLADRRVVVCVSRLVPRKGQDTLIEALPAVHEAVPDAALLIVGSGPYREQLEASVRRLGLERSVVFTGGVPQVELPRHYAAGDVFAMPCRTRRAGMDVEGLGIVYLEASAVGLPVVAGDSGGAPDAVRENETGYVVPGGDPAALARRLTELLGDPAARDRMGKAGRAWVEREWRWDVLAERLRGLLQD